MANPLIGSWTYRSLLNDPDLDTKFDDLEFGVGTIVFTDDGPGGLGGTIGGPGWSLDLHGSAGFGSPMQVRFQGKGVVGGEEWIYDYIGWLVPVWPSSTDAMQVPAIVGSVTRTIPHSSSGGGTSPAGVVASFYAVHQG
jgi:hypothetical protein